MVMMSTDEDMRKFFKSSHFAVLGASTNTAKWGHKVFVWYIEHSLPVTPINPAVPAIKVADKEYPTIEGLSNLENPKDTSVSIITPWPVTLEALAQAKKLGVPAVWLQPGTFNDEVLTFARQNFDTVVAGRGGEGSEGWCVLVDGEYGLQSVGKL